MRVAEKVATVDILSGRTGRMGHGALDPDGADRLRRATRAESKDQWQEAIEAVVQMWESEYFEFHGKYLDFPRRMVTPEAGPGSPPAVLDGGDEPRERRRSPGQAGPRAAGIRILQPLQAMAEQIRQYREAASQPDADHPGHHQQGGGLHPGALRRRPWPRPRTTGSGTRCGGGTRTWPSSPSSGSSRNFSQEEQDRTFPLLKRRIEGKFDPTRSATPT